MASTPSPKVKRKDARSGGEIHTADEGPATKADPPPPPPPEDAEEELEVEEEEEEEEEEEGSSWIFGYLIPSLVVAIVAVLLFQAPQMYREWESAGGRSDLEGLSNFVRGQFNLPFPDLVDPIPIPESMKLLDQPKLADLDQFSGQYEEERLWGTYRPHAYLGLRTRQPCGLLAGLMWFDPKRASFSDLELRYKVDPSDRLRQYGWQRHDGVNFGLQKIVDGEKAMETQFIKLKPEGAGYGGDWVARVNVDTHTPPPYPDRFTSLLFYIAHEDPRPAARWKVVETEKDVYLSGYDSKIGYWEFHINGVSAQRVKHVGFRIADMTQLTDKVRKKLSMKRERGRAPAPDLHGGVEEGSNVYVFQVSARLPVDVYFHFLSSKQPLNEHKRAARRVQLSSLKINSLAKAHAAAFDKAFEAAFPSAREKDAAVTAGVKEMCKVALSGVLGSLGYSYGRPQVKDPGHRPSGDDNPAEGVLSYSPVAMFTGAPDLSDAPHGVQFEEGFHALLLQRWDARLSREVLAHWLDLLSADGWMAPEPVLGAESRSMGSNVAPLSMAYSVAPSLLLPLLREAHQAVAADAAGEGAEFFARALPRLRAWLGWMKSTQAGTTGQSFRWSGRELAASFFNLNAPTAASSLPDYPRSAYPSFRERHLDLYCWMALGARTLATAAAAAGVPADAYTSAAAKLEDLEQLRTLHLSPGGYFADWGNHTEAEMWMERPRYRQHPKLPRPPLMRVVDQTLPAKEQFVQHVGYVTLFPLMMKLLAPSSPELPTILRLLRSEEHLWTEYGLRSLSAASALYGKPNNDEHQPMYRGAISVHMNYLALAGLHHYAKADGPHAADAAQLYETLRRNLLATIERSYQRTGHLWEQYSDRTGEGQGRHPFGGGTSLVVLIMAEAF